MRSSLMPVEVEAVFQNFQAPVQRRLLAIRRMIFDVSDETEVGPILETLKWGEPAYLTPVSKSGTTIRLGAAQNASTDCAISFHCQTSLVKEFREQFSSVFQFDRNRAIIVTYSETLPELEIKACLARALTYHRKGLLTDALKMRDTTVR